ERFFRFKMDDINNKLTQALINNKIIETTNPGSISKELAEGLRKALKSSEFDFQYFISPIRDLVPKPDPISLYMTQYVLEILIDHPDVVEIYGTDQQVYETINNVLKTSYAEFEKIEQEIITQLSHNKDLVPGSREYEIVLDQLLRKRMGEPKRI
ncbi:MAG: hypothetical protein DRG39_05965, partial [Deltaproteobacteria bacterium]